MNARLVDFVNGDYVTITLRPGQSIEHYSGGATDEGWAHTVTIWAFDGNGDYVTRTEAGRALDCDGITSWDHVSSCPIGLLRAHRATGDDVGLWPPMPEWSNGHRSQRDYAAESAGY